MAELAMLADRQRTAQPQSGHPSSQQSGAGQGKFAGRDRRSNHYATPPTKDENRSFKNNDKAKDLTATLNHLLVATWVLQQTLGRTSTTAESDNKRNVRLPVMCLRPSVLGLDRSQTKLETKASSHEGQCIPAGSSVSPPKRVLITVSIMTMCISRKFCVRLFTLCKISTAIFESCGAT